MSVGDLGGESLRSPLFEATKVAKERPYARCRLCGELRYLTFEHVPPQKAFNNKPIFLQEHEHLFEESSRVYGKRKKSQRGMGEYSLCDQCQHTTGSWYAKHYVPFAHQAAQMVQRSLVQKDSEPHVFHIQPCEVIKQVLVMFATAERSGMLLERPEYRGYLLSPTSTSFPGDLRVYMYYTVSGSHRFNGWGALGDGVQIYSCAEIAFHPIGLVLSFNKIPPHPRMEDITYFSRFQPREHRRVCLDPPILNVSTAFSGTYDAAFDRMGRPIA
mgnify:CR=1 FL=1